MRSMWTGPISFGLVTIPTKMYTATEDDKTTFRMVCPEHGARIQFKRVCSHDGEEVPYAEIGKGYETAAGDLLLVTQAELDALPLKTIRQIEVVQFIPGDALGLAQVEKTYYLAPDKGGEKAYALMVQAMGQAGRVALAKVVIRQKEKLAVVRPDPDTSGLMVLQLLHWPSEIRSPDFPFLDKTTAVSDAEVAMAVQLIGMMSGEFDPAAWSDEYEAALNTMIEAKLAGEALPAAPAGEPAAPAGDLAALLAASMAAKCPVAPGAPAPDGAEATPEPAAAAV
jgi:DNA end-binding protein Ku